MAPGRITMEEGEACHQSVTRCRTAAEPPQGLPHGCRLSSSARTSVPNFPFGIPEIFNNLSRNHPCSELHSQADELVQTAGKARMLRL
jgi:hypothetical protein